MPAGGPSSSRRRPAGASGVTGAEQASLESGGTPTATERYSGSGLAFRQPGATEQTRCSIARPDPGSTKRRLKRAGVDDLVYEGKGLSKGGGSCGEPGPHGLTIDFDDPSDGLPFRLYGLVGDDVRSAMWPSPARPTMPSLARTLTSWSFPQGGARSSKGSSFIYAAVKRTSFHCGPDSGRSP